MTHGVREVDVRRTILIALIHLVPFYLAFTPVTDPDIWWHLAAGRWIWANGAFPDVDPFSWGEARPWHAYSWGFDVLVFGLYHIAGLKGVAVFKASLVMAVIWRLFSLLRFITPDFSRVAVLIVPGLFALLAYLHVRPWLFTILCSILLFEILFRAQASKDPRRLLWLLPLFVFWANIHIQFIYGVGVVGIFLAAAYCEHKFTDWRSPADIPYRHYGLALLSIILAPLLSPYHYHLYETAWLYAEQSRIYPLIKELSPLKLDNAWSFAIFALAFAGFWKLGKTRFRTLLPYVLLPLAAFMALRMLRDSWFLMLIVLFLFTNCFAQETAQREQETKYRLPPRFRWATVAIIAVGALVIATTKQINTETDQEKFRGRYPVEAVKYLAEERPPGPVFNHFDWGGYLIWNLPGYRVSFDGRTNVYGSEAVIRHVKTWRALPQWQDNPVLAEARLVLAPRGKPLTSVLRVHPGYDVIYQDETAVIFAARKPGKDSRAGFPEGADRRYCGSCASRLTIP